MPCKKCVKEAVIILPNSNVKLCKNCFIKYFEKKVVKTITKYKLIEKNDKIAIAISSGKDSFTALYLLNKLAEKKMKLNIVALAIDEGIKGYRNLDELKKYCKNNNIKLYIYSFKKEFGKTLDLILKKHKLKPCSVCGVLRRFLLNKKARELKVNKLATGHNLDDEAQSILMNQIKGNIERSSRLGPLTGVIKDKRFVPRIKPLYFLTEKEVATYAFLKKFPVKYAECTYYRDSLRSDVIELLNNLEEKYPGTKHAIINSFLDILPNLKKKYKYTEIKNCKKCNEPCSQDICMTCQLIEKIKV